MVNRQEEKVKDVPISKENKPGFLQSVVQILCNLGKSASENSKAAVETATGATEAATKQTHKIIEQATHTAGEVANRLGENWLIRKVSGVLNLNWLVGAVDSVNLQKAIESVKKLQQEHPSESPSQISHRIMVEKAAKAGSIGLATSILPGVAAALFAIDLAATTELQSEMVYQIASAYGLDSKDPARKGEVIAIFGLALGGGRLLKAAGLGLLRNIPFAGAIISASSNATMIYSLGYAACRFYEAKLDASKSLNSEETLEELKQESEKYLETAIAQEAVMDQILVHMILTTYPEKTWEQILPELQTLHLSSNSLEAITQNIKSPKSLDTLLQQLNRDFAIPLLAQCYRIAASNGEITQEEKRILDAIEAKTST